MKKWQETERLFERLHTVLSAGGAGVLALVTHIEGSTYRRPGAKLLIEADGRMVGNVSGGCLEADVRENALQVLADGASRRIHYDTGEAEDQVWGMGLGCNGKVDIGLLRLDAGHLNEINAVLQRLKGDQPFVVSYDLTVGTFQVIDGAPTTSAAVFGDRFEPPPTLLICGAGEDALPLAALADTIGFRVVVADHRPAYLTEERFPMARLRVVVRPENSLPDELKLNERTLAVVKTHVLQHDAAWVQGLLASDAPYIGLLGPRDRRDEILKQVDPQHHPRIYGPIGLDVGGEGPEQVALSIVAEALAVWHGRNGASLRQRATPIHDK